MLSVLKNTFKFSGFILPFIIAISVFVILQKPKNIANSNELFQEVSEINDSMINSWIEEKSEVLKVDFFDKLKIKKESRIYKFKELDIRKQEILKFVFYSKVKKDCDSVLNAKDNMQDEQYRKIKDFKQKITARAEYQKKLIYNYYGADLHPLDKMFLDDYDVYLLN